MEMIPHPSVLFQRLARYPLLFSQILHYTEAEEQDFTDIKLAIRNAQQVLARTNEQLKQEEDKALLVQLSEHLIFPEDENIVLDLTAPTRSGRQRRLVKDGDLVKGYAHRRQSKRKDLHVYLFNDILLLTTKNVGLRERFSGRAPAHDTDAIYIYRAVGSQKLP